MNNKVLVIMGSDSDLPVLMPAFEFFDKMAVEYEVHISSAHRLPEKTAELARMAEANGFGVIIGAAGGAAHLPGVLAALTVLPVIGIPVKSETLLGLDSLYSIVQMPSGIPVATVAINGSKNAAILASQILAVADSDLRERLRIFKSEMAEQVEAKDVKLNKLGVNEYLKSKKQ
ncbi:MAG: 5-(carboxyamino)imidazole ribonucleotide mutase [Clostridia bacterium]|nr:5-(carboxyamino)imidazole ribonucleotide mutase [Clostridia bacterium]